MPICYEGGTIQFQQVKGKGVIYFEFFPNEIFVCLEQHLKQKTNK